MDIRELISEQLRMSSGGMQSVVKGDISPEDAVARPQNLTPIIWQVGHIAYYEALLVSAITGDDADIPENYESLFKTGSEGDDDFPPFAEVIAALERSQAAVFELVDGDLSAPLAGEPLYTSVGGALMFTHYHRGYHLGKIMTLRGLLGKDIIF